MSVKENKTITITIKTISNHYCMYIFDNYISYQAYLFDVFIRQVFIQTIFNLHWIVTLLFVVSQNMLYTTIQTHLLLNEIYIIK